MTTNRGYIPKGTKHLGKPDGGEKNHRSFERSCATTNIEERWAVDPERQSAFDRNAILLGTAKLPSGAEAFYDRAIFVCDYQGLPIYCETCHCYKPDRSHHSSDVGRCVRRMDHFCPWVGGMVCETNHKWFIQFLVYAAFFSVFVLITNAYMLSDQQRRIGDLNAHIIVATGIGGLFSLFSVGMAGNTIHLAFQNITTVETLDRARRFCHLAVFVNARELEAIITARSARSSNDAPSPYETTITYPLQPAPPRTSTERNSTTDDRVSEPSRTGPALPSSSREPRTFAVLRTHSGDNPWDLGPFSNWKQIMGARFVDWFLPIKHSPMCRRDRSDFEYPFGPVVDRLKREAGIPPAISTIRDRKTRRRHSSVTRDSVNNSLSHSDSDHSRRRRRKRHRRRRSTREGHDASDATHV